MRPTPQNHVFTQTATQLAPVWIATAFQYFRVTSIFGKSRDQNRKEPKARVVYTSGCRNSCQWLTIAKMQNYTHRFFYIRVTVRATVFSQFNAPGVFFLTWPDRPDVCLKPAFNWGPAFINKVQFSLYFFNWIITIYSPRPRGISIIPFVPTWQTVH